MQRTILNNAAKYVKKDGYIVYSTCTITKQENEKVIQEFLKDNENFVLDDVNQFLPKGICTENKFLKLFPNIHKMDGFFIAKLKRIR
ncbi:hypothetical protein PL321_17240 [Caloramator sp. mosi_1]|nr:hypothetical protein [Caloramator sp. mosi_1]WDC85875.1 hypothetical protein PL321_17240 [Caloramator sp. mosi_1]